MTTQFKITRADLTADASQNRETVLVNGAKYVIAGKLNEASVIQRPNGSKLYLALPVNDGKDGIYGANRYRIARPIAHGESFDGTPAKPANAQAASAHTPGISTSSHTMRLYNREHVEQTAAEHDRLQVELNDQYELAKVFEKQRDQAREQVKTLLAELNNIVKCDIVGMREDFGDDTDRQFRQWAQSRAKAALASVESEQAK